METKELQKNLDRLRKGNLQTQAKQVKELTKKINALAAMAAKKNEGRTLLKMLSDLEEMVEFNKQYLNAVSK